MRPFLILLAGFLGCSSGCSTFVASRGVHVENLTTRAQVHEKFGKPTVSDGSSVDEYHTRRKIADPELALACRNMEIVMTCGLAEFIAFPWELCQLGRHTIVGQDLRFSYDARGFVTHISLDGDERFSLPGPGDDAKPNGGTRQQAAAVPASAPVQRD